MANIEFSTVLTPSATTRLYGHNSVDSGGFPTQSGNFAVTDIASALGTLLEFRQDASNSRLYTLYINGTPSASFETPPDKFLESVIFNEDTLCLELTFYEGDVTETVSVSMSKLVDVYLAGNGISKSGTTFSVKAKTGGYVIVDEQGVDVDLTSVNSRIATVEGRVTDVETQLDGHIDEINTALQGAREAEENAEASSTSASQSASSAQSSANTATAKATEANNSAVSAGNIKTQVQQIADEIESNMIVSIEQTVTSSESLGVNEVTITQEDGTESTFEVRNGAKGDKGDKGDPVDITVSADKTIFQLNSNGEPYAGQEIAVSVTKQNISDDVVIESSPFKTEGESFKVVPNMLGLEPIELTQMLSDTFEDSSKWSYSGSGTINIANGVLTQTVGSVQYDAIYINSYGLNFYKNHKYYIALVNKSTTTSEISFRISLRKSTFTDFYTKYFDLELFAENQRFSFVYESDSDYLNGTFSFGMYQAEAGTTHKYSEPILMDITDLIASSPKLQAMTDAELTTWCDTYIPFIGAGETWTVGGRAKNYIKPYEDEWTDSPAGAYGFVCGNVSEAKNEMKLGDYIYSYAEAKYTTTNITPNSITLYLDDGYVYVKGYSSPVANTVYVISGIASSMKYARLHAMWVFCAPQGSIGQGVISVRNNARQINLTQSGWLAQLSLMGIESDADIKAFLDECIPFFEGEMDFPRFTEATIKASAGGFSDYLSILAYTQPRSLKLSATPSKFKLDADNKAQEDSIVIKAHKTNIREDVSWSNDRNIPMVEGDVQTLYAYQMGLKPVELKRNDEEVILTHNGSITTSSDVYTFVGTVNLSFALLRPNENNISAEFADSNTWFARVKIKNLASSSAISYIYINSGTVFAYNSVTIATEAEATVYILGTFRDSGSRQFQFRCTPTDTSVNAYYELSEITFVPVTELLALPKLSSMTDAEKLEWLNTYIPTIEPNSTWTVGGKATNLLPNPTSSDGWEARSAVTGFSASNGIVTGSMSKAMNSYDDSWLRKPLGNNPFVIGDSVYIHFGDISGTNFAFGLSYWRFASNANSGIRSVERANDFDKYITVGANLSQSATVTIDTTKGINVLNLTSSGWLAQLSLMGIEGNDSIKAWIDENVPFFVGEMDFPYYKDVTYTASYEGLEDSITIVAELVLNREVLNGLVSSTNFEKVYADEHHINGWLIKTTNGELVFSYEG